MASLPPAGRHAARIGRRQHRLIRRPPGRAGSTRTGVTPARGGARPTAGGVAPSAGGGAGLLGLAGVLLLVASMVLSLQDQRDFALGRVPAAASARAAATPGAALAAPAPAASPRQGRPVGFAPSRLTIPRLEVDAAVVPVSVGSDRSLGVPADPAVLGWWRDGARAGQAGGSVVIDGHVDSAKAGPGALFHLRALVPGDVVTITGKGRTQRYVVAARRQYPKTTLPSSIFDQGVTGRLVLVTCGGRFDRRTRHYADNVVVFANPA